MAEKTQNIYAALSEVQATLKAPKGQYNTFGKYHYRSAEDIVEAVKPVLAKNGLVMTIQDAIELIGERFYVRATATLHLISDPAKTVVATGYAREEDNKKGMDGSQITGAASSYARKYALNGLFNIDDTKDADTDEHRNVQENAPAESIAEPVVEREPEESPLDQLKRQVNALLEEQGYKSVPAKKAFIIKVLKKTTLETVEDADAVIDQLAQEAS